jgi:glycine betaine/choline ABC-type transport system substrate-binding protein
MLRNTAKICKHVIKKKLLIASKDITEETTLFLQNVLNVSLISAAQKPTLATRKTLASALKSGSVDFVNANLSMTAKVTSTA